MNLLENEFHPIWWNVLKDEFNKESIKNIYSQIKSDVDKGMKILPSSNVIYNRFKIL